MVYQSTRGKAPSVTSPEAILKGLADDGGLYLPASIPQLPADALSPKHTYAELAALILRLFLPEYERLLPHLCKEAYESGRFEGKSPAPLHALADGMFCQELWHGPTAAFKDMALQLMPRLLSAGLSLTGETREACILTATSGDTGKAALEGFCDVPGTRILVFYPVDGVSPLQKRQMATQEGNNVAVQAIHGNFDDAQTAVKAIFSDMNLRAKIAPRAFLSSANSINFGRLVPQIVYYVDAYRSLLSRGVIRAGDRVNFCVPTGNFGNIFAAYLAKRMGLPIGKLICASNQNNVLSDFLQQGIYDKNRPFFTTMSPSMDILVSSNLERLLYLILGADETRDCMERLSRDGKYELSDAARETLSNDFYGVYQSEEETARVIRELFETQGYLTDPHTAVGLGAAKRYRALTHDTAPLVCASTASAYKFPQSVLLALGTDAPADEFKALQMLSEFTHTSIPAPIAALAGKDIRFTGAIERDEMSACVERFVRAD